MNSSNLNGAKSMVMIPLYAAKTQIDRKKKQNQIRAQKHKNKIYD